MKRARALFLDAGAEAGRRSVVTSMHWQANPSLLCASKPTLTLVLMGGRGFPEVHGTCADLDAVALCTSTSSTYPRDLSRGMCVRACVGGCCRLPVVVKVCWAVGLTGQDGPVGCHNPATAAAEQQLAALA